jgi:hypothetical protein
MSLRKSPTLTPALLAANRRNAQKSTGPRTRRGKAWSSLNRMKEGGRSRDYREFFRALLDAPVGGMEAVVENYLGSRLAVHPHYRDIADVFIQVELGMG